MDVRVILLPKHIGASEYDVPLSVQDGDTQHMLEEARSLMKNVRKLETGDVIVLPERFFIVERTGYREVSASFFSVWRRKTGCEREMGCSRLESCRRDQTMWSHREPSSSSASGF